MGRASGRFVGRDIELSRLGESVASARDGSPAAVVVEGDAGIGKSRLVTEALAAFRELKDVVAIGHGVELAGGELPYGVAAEALRSLVRDAGVEAVRAAADQSAAALAPLLPQFGPSDGGADALRLLPAYVSTLENLAADRLVWLVVEDLQWVDSPSRDLLAYLLRVATASRLLMLMTVRTHDPAADAAAAQLASNIAAQPGFDRITLAPLGPRDLVALVGDLAESATDQQVDRVVSLSQGSPLFAEQLVAAGLPEAGPVPEQVLAPMTARVSALDPATCHLIQLASLAEGHLTHRLLSRAYAPTAPDGAVLEPAIARGLELHILRVNADRHSYSFTHPLLRQAAEDALTPAERIRGHRTWAEVLSAPENHGGDRLLEIAAAHHWAESENDVEAFDSCLRAAEHASWLGGRLEEATLLRRALALWDRLPTSKARSERNRDALVLDTVYACHSAGCVADAVELLHAEMNRAVETDPLRMLCLRVMHEDFRARVGAAVDTTVFDEARARVNELFTARPAPFTTGALRSLGWYLRYTHPEESFRLHAYAAQVVSQVDSKRRGAAPTAYVDHLATRGRFDEALAMLDEARAESVGSHVQMSIDCDIGETHYRAGRLHEAVGAYERSLGRLHDPQLTPRWWAYVSHLLAIALHDAGDWGRADAVLSQAVSLEYDDPETKAMVTATAGQFACRRGDLEQAQSLATATRSLLTHYLDQAFFPALAYTLQLEAELAVGRGDLQAARLSLRRLVTAPDIGAQGDLWEGVVLAASVEGDLAESSNADAEHRSAVRVAADRLPHAGAYWSACHHQALAELARAEGADDAALWQGATEAWRALGHVPRLAWALLRRAEVHLGGGDRHRAAIDLTEAWDIAGGTGAVPLKDAVIALARRGRILLGTPTAGHDMASAGGRLARLTDRELEVLQHLVKGATNDELAAALFISPKTASVHVSRILAKLDVTSRAKAAAVAYEDGLFADER